jgi:hypothetical protein
MIIKTSKIKFSTTEVYHMWFLSFLKNYSITQVTVILNKALLNQNAADYQTRP